MIEVVLRWSGDVVEVTHVDGKLTVGRRVDDDLFVPLECVESVALVEKTADGFMLNVPRGMRGFIAHHRERLDVHADGMTIAIDDDTRAHLASGPFTLEVRKARRTRLPLLAPIFDALWANTATLTLASMGILVAIFSLGSAHGDEPVVLPIARTVIAHVTAPPTKTAATHAPSAPPVPTPTTHVARRTRPAASTRPAQARVDDRKVVETKIAALFSGSGIDSLVGSNNFAETAAAIGSIDGRRSASTSNVGLDARPTGEGPWSSTMQIGSIATQRPISDGPRSFGAHRDRAVPEVHIDNVDVVGTLDRDLIKRVVQQHIDQVRYCYERELIGHPGLEEKIVASWTIGADGRVRRSAADVDDAVASCVRAKIASWIFPKPRGGGDVLVRYPFVLRPAH